MKEILVDTNVLLSFLTDRDKSQQEQAAALFRGAADREHALILHSITLIEMVHVFIHVYEADPLDVADSVSKLLEMPGVVPVTDITWSLVLERWPHVIRPSETRSSPPSPIRAAMTRWPPSTAHSGRN